MRFVQKVRDRLLGETGIDFAAYRSPELMDSLDAWAAGMRLAGDAGFAALATLAVLALAAWWALGGDFGLFGSGMVMLGGGVAASGVGLLAWERRTLRRIPRELDQVLVVARDLTARVATDLRTSVADPAQLARGLAVVTAGPMVARATARRFLVLSPVVEPFLTAVIARVLERTLPLVRLRVDAPAEHIDRVSEVLGAWRNQLGSRLSRYVSVALAPVRFIGFVLGGLGIVVLAGAAFFR
jgi:hypothetical protein